MNCVLLRIYLLCVQRMIHTTSYECSEIQWSYPTAQSILYNYQSVSQVSHTEKIKYSCKVHHHGTADTANSHLFYFIYFIFKDTNGCSCNLEIVFRLEKQLLSVPCSDHFIHNFQYFALRLWILSILNLLEGKAQSLRSCKNIWYLWLYTTASLVSYVDYPWSMRLGSPFVTLTVK